MRQFKKRKQTQRIIGVGLGIVLVVGLVYGGNLLLNRKDGSPQTPEPPVVSNSKTQLTLLAIGDMMFHQLQLDRADHGGTYDFNENFDFIRDRVQAADIAFTNFEGSIDHSKPYSGYPAFNTPPEVFKAMSAAGFDVISTANNHILDTGLAGLEGVADAIGANGMLNVGTSKQADEHPIVYVTKNEITVAFIDYAENFNGNDTAETLRYANGIDKTAIEAKVKEAKTKSDFVVTYFHWGEEYSSQSNQFQQELAANVADWGADLVLGSHVHMVQDGTIIDRGSEPVYVLYGMGNALSNQRADTINDLIGDRASLSEDGLMSTFTLEKDKETQETRLIKVSFEPTWVNKTLDGGTYKYQILVCKDVIDGTLTGIDTSVILDRVKQSYQNTMKRIGLVDKSYGE